MADNPEQSRRDQLSEVFSNARSNEDVMSLLREIRDQGRLGRSEGRRSGRTRGGRPEGETEEEYRARVARELGTDQVKSRTYEEEMEELQREAEEAEKKRKQQEEEKPMDQDLAEIQDQVNGYSKKQLLMAVVKVLRYAQFIKTEFEDKWKNDPDNKDVNGTREYDSLVDQIKALGNTVNSTENPQAMTELKNLVSNFAGMLKKYESKGKEFELEAFKRPKSFRELCQLIMEAADERFKEGGEKQLVDKEGNVHLGNFEAWARSQLVDLRTNINTNSPINPWSEVYAETPFRNIGFLEIYRNKSYRRKEKTVVGTVTQADVNRKEKDANGRTLTASMIGQPYERVVYEEDKEVSNMLEHIANQFFLFQHLHNFDVDMRGIRGAEAEVPKVLAQYMNRNILTEKRSRLLFLLKLNGTNSIKNASEINEILKSETMINRGKVGDGLRRALLAYYYLGEIGASNDQLDKDENGNYINMFERVLGENGKTAFYQSLVKQAIRDKAIGNFRKQVDHMLNQQEQQRYSAMLMPMEKLIKDKEKAGEEWLDDIINNTTYRRDLVEIFGQVGVTDMTESDLTQGALSDKDYSARVINKAYHIGKKSTTSVLAVLNLFSQRNAESEHIDLLKKGIQDAIRQTEKLDSDDAKYAETIASSMWYSMGISARNDLAGIGFDAWSKIINFMRYRLKQSEGRLLPGDIQNIFGLKRLGLTPFEAWEGTQDDGKKKNLIELLQGINPEDPDEKKREASHFDFDNFNDFDFKGDQQSHFAGDHVNNAYRIYHWLLEDDIDWDDFFEWDKGVLKFKIKSANEILDDKYHALRYAFDNIRIRWNDETRSVEYEIDWKETKKTGTVEYKALFKNKKLRDSAFNEQVNNMNMYDRKGVENEDQVHPKVARDVLSYIIGKEIWAHTYWRSNYTKWSDAHLGHLLGFFRSFSATGVEPGRTLFGDDIVKLHSPFFSYAEWNRILKLGKRSTSYYLLRTALPGLAFLPIEVLWAIAMGTEKAVKPKGIEAGLPGLEVIFGQVG